MSTPETIPSALFIDDAIGESSYFHEQFGYHARSMGPETARLPKGWELRLVPVESPAIHGMTGWCLETNDLAISKYIAEREKDRSFTAVLSRVGLTDRNRLFARLPETELGIDRRWVVTVRISFDFRSARKDD